MTGFEIKPEFEDLARGMLEENIIKFGGKFTLKSGKQSVAYVNLREMISVPQLFVPAVEAYASTIEDSGLKKTSSGQPRLLCAVPEAAAPYGGAVAYRTGMPQIQHRVKPKQHGQPRAIEGRFSEGDEVVLLDDVITDAEAKLEEARELGAFGLRTRGVVVLVDRQQGGRSEIWNNEMGFAAAMTLSGIAKYALDERLAGVTQALYDDLLSELNPNEL